MDGVADRLGEHRRPCRRLPRRESRHWRCRRTDGPWRSPIAAPTTSSTTARAPRRRGGPRSRSWWRASRSQMHPERVAGTGVHGTADRNRRGTGTRGGRDRGHQWRHPALHAARLPAAGLDDAGDSVRRRCIPPIGRPSMAWTGTAPANALATGAGAASTTSTTVGRFYIVYLEYNPPVADVTNPNPTRWAMSYVDDQRYLPHRPQLVLRQRVVVRVRHRPAAAGRGRSPRRGELFDSERRLASRLALPGVVPATCRRHVELALQQQERLASDRLGSVRRAGRSATVADEGDVRVEAVVDAERW